MRRVYSTVWVQGGVGGAAAPLTFVGAAHCTVYGYLRVRAYAYACRVAQAIGRWAGQVVLEGRLGPGRLRARIVPVGLICTLKVERLYPTLGGESVVFLFRILLDYGGRGV
jgi:hypothetical protein